MPIQRIPRYELLLKELLKQTPPTHPDVPLLTKAVEDVHQIAMTINDQKRLNENMTKMLQIQNVLGPKAPDLIQPHRRIVKEGSLQLVQRGGTELVSCYVFLFNDSLLLTQMNTSSVNISSSMVFRHFQVLQHCRVEFIPPTDGPCTWSCIYEKISHEILAGVKFGFEIFFPQVVIQFAAADEEKMNEWISLIRESIQFFTAASSSRLSASSCFSASHA